VAPGPRKSHPHHISGNEIDLSQQVDNSFSNGLFGYNWMCRESPGKKNESKTIESSASDVKWGSDIKFQGNGYLGTWIGKRCGR
jgi:hypothetical protein